MSRLANSVLRVTDRSEWRIGVASKIYEVLAHCDSLQFRDHAEVAGYAALHLVDRYGRVNQVLMHLLGIGRLPLRKQRVRILEVGCGPAPALYGAADFYADLDAWPGRGEVEAGRVMPFALDRGPSWCRFIHQLSEDILARSEKIHGLPFGADERRSSWPPSCSGAY